MEIYIKHQNNKLRLLNCQLWSFQLNYAALTQLDLLLWGLWFLGLQVMEGKVATVVP